MCPTCSCPRSCRRTSSSADNRDRLTAGRGGRPCPQRSRMRTCWGASQPRDRPAGQRRAPARRAGGPYRIHRPARALRPARVPALVRPGPALAPGRRRSCRGGSPAAGARRRDRPGRGGAGRRRPDRRRCRGRGPQRAHAPGRAAKRPPPGASGPGAAGRRPRRPAPVRRRHLRRGDLLLPAALRGRPGCDDRRDGAVPAPGRGHGEPGVLRPAAAGVARRLVVLHAAGPARAGRHHRRPRLVRGGPVPGAEHLGPLPAIPPGRARRRLARGRPDRRRGGADEPGRRADHVGQQIVSTSSKEKPAFYAVGRGTGGLGDWVTLLHPPYTLWHLSYVVMGAAVMPPLVVWRLGGTLIAFFLAVGIGAHALDELKGRPLGTGIGSTTLAVTAVVSIAGAVALGLVYGGLRLVPFVVLGCLLVFSYNLELFGGIMHSDIWFGLAWGSFPALVGAYAQHWTLSVAAVAVAAAAFFLSMGQRALSTPARTLRRRVSGVSVQITYSDGRERQLGRADLLAPLERALRFFVWATGAVALAMALAAR